MKTTTRRWMKWAVCLVLSAATCSCRMISADAGDIDDHPAAAAVSRLEKDIRAGIDTRGIREYYNRYTAYTADRLDASADRTSFRDKTGNCRLKWFDHLLRHPIESIGETEAFSRSVHHAFGGPHVELEHSIVMAAEKLDAVVIAASPLPEAPDLLGAVTQSLVRASDAFDRAVYPLREAERDELRALGLALATEENELGHRFGDAVGGRRLCDLLERLDRTALMEAALALTPAIEVALREPVVEIQGYGATAPGVSGPLAALIETKRGTVLVGGEGDNVYRLDEMPGICAVIDVGGNDRYEEGTVSAERPVLLLVDLAGDDVYTGRKPGIQAAAIGGVSLLVDRSGNDAYEAVEAAQGTCLAGVGLLIDVTGNDRYSALRRAQGYAMGGLGFLVDLDGDDDYHAAVLAQGVGAPLGFGLLEDRHGKDHYYAGGKFSGGYDDSPGYGSWSQGVGVGPRGIANGGIGLLLDGGDDDVYEGDYFGHGGGYWFAVGIARDFGGNDKRYGASLKAFDGSERDEKRFLRWGLGYGCHYALGFLFDDSGDDLYEGNTACLGFAWDIAVGAVCDFGGNDRYEAGGSAMGQAANAGLGVVADMAGDDIYDGRTPGLAREKIDYHPQEKAGGNFSFLIDYAGTDEYGDGLTNNVTHQRGWAGGFVIDRD